MARLDELAEGLAKVLKVSANPEPLPIDLVDEGPSETTVLALAIVDASLRHDAPLDRICFDPHLSGGLLKEHGEEYEGLKLVADNRLANRIEIWRNPVSRGFGGVREQGFSKATIRY